MRKDRTQICHENHTQRDRRQEKREEKVRETQAENERHKNTEERNEIAQFGPDPLHPGAVLTPVAARTPAYCSGRGKPKSVNEKSRNEH